MSDKGIDKNVISNFGLGLLHSQNALSWKNRNCGIVDAILTKIEESVIIKSLIS